MIKINTEHNEFDSYTINDLPVGTVFKFENSVYIKTNKHNAVFESISAVNLETGEHKWFDETVTIIEPVKIDEIKASRIYPETGNI